MSFRRHQSFAINKMTYLDNRLAQFTNVPMYTYDLLVKRNTDICGNLHVGGNLTVNGDINATNFRASGNFYLDNYILVPAGTIVVSAATASPSGWLPCDGNTYYISTYLDLFNAIGNTFAYGDTSLYINGQFKVPDLRGRTAIGVGQGAGLSNRTLGDMNGEENHTLTVGEMPSHSHTYNDAYFAENTGNGQNNLFGTSGSTDNDNSFRWRTQAGGASTTPSDINTSSIGTSQAHNNMQPYMVLRYIIKF